MATDLSTQSSEFEGPVIRGTLKDSHDAFDSEAPRILPNEVTKGQELAQGSFGTVYRGWCRGQEVAIKELNAESIDGDALEAFRKEVAIMSHLRHPNIVLLMGACTEGDVMFIITEYLPRGDLDKLLESGNEITITEKIKLLNDIALGMCWLHNSNPIIIHRDLKPGNILLTDDMTAKVGDLGLSTILSKIKIRSYGAGSYLWMAPEALSNEKHNEKVDVYSFGIVMWQLLHWDTDPFAEYLALGSLQALIDAVCDNMERPPLAENTHPSLVRIVELSWHQNPENRPSFQTIINWLDDAMVETMFTDPSAIKFWNAYWGRKTSKNGKTQTTVSFSTFARALYSLIGESYPKNPEGDQRILCLRAMVGVKEPRGDYTVTLHSFSTFMKWFGPLSKSIVDEIFEIVSHPWFHGDIARQEAQNLVESYGKPLGYLVRLSTSEPIQASPFTITKLKGSVVHQRVYFENGEFYVTIKEKGLSKKLSSSVGLADLIKKLHNKKMLKYPVPRARYHEIFAKNLEEEGYTDYI
eukprot:TRINITY_DN4842_c0_g1_i1.p1 TRINITY_DN4842_c0_g1~~TRINITY_DN4842_c0_g1_i1.p1  ORF type:complete len:532 (-),score=87.99 TRINITY_DN4842_c0_g1_i1:68-1642(-)